MGQENLSIPQACALSWYNPNNTQFNTITLELSDFPHVFPLKKQKKKTNDSLVKALTTWLYV